MRRVNLLPPEERRRRSAIPTTTRAGVVGILLIAGAVLLIAMIGLFLLYFIRTNNEQERIAQLDDNIARQQARVRELNPYADLQARLDAKKPIADGIFQTRFPWDLFLTGLAFVIPKDTALGSFVGVATPINIGAGGAGSAEEQTLDPPGSIAFSGVALPRYQNVSDFIVRMNNLRYLANAELISAELDRETFAEDAINFEVAAELVTRVGETGDAVVVDTEGEEDSSDDEQEDPPGGLEERPGEDPGDLPEEDLEASRRPGGPPAGTEAR